MIVPLVWWPEALTFSMADLPLTPETASLDLLFDPTNEGKATGRAHSLLTLSAARRAAQAAEAL